MTNGHRELKPPAPTHEQYNRQVAGKFDELINWRKRNRACGDFFCRILSENNCKRVLDMATGTGFDSITLLKHGFDVVSLDGSPHMMEKAIENARKHHVTLNPVIADWRRMDSALEANFNAAVCLGNSFCHIEHKERENVIGRVRSLLEAGGIFIVDYRNYGRLLKNMPLSLGDAGYYSGTGMEATFELRDGIVSHKYTFKDGASFTLSFKPVFIEEAAGELEKGRFSITIYSDFKSGLDNNASFYQIVGKAG